MHTVTHTTESAALHDALTTHGITSDDLLPRGVA